LHCIALQNSSAQIEELEREVEQMRSDLELRDEQSSSLQEQVRRSECSESRAAPIAET